jgi:ATP/ADP translocase
MLSWLAIQPGEGRPALLTFVYLFLIISSYLMIKTVRNALFISEYGAMKLPYVMVGVAVLAGVFAAGYIRLARRLTTWRLVFWGLIFFVSNLLLFWWLAIRGRTWLYPVIYMWAGVYGVIAPMQVWTLANELFTTRQAKRLFGFVGAGGILGGFAGGVLANRLAPLVGTSNLLLVVAGMLCLAALIVYIVASRGFVQPRTAFEAPPPQNLRQSLGIVFGSQHLRLLAALVFISALVTTSVDFQFNVVAERHVSGRDELTAFFGAVYAGIALASFLVQILFTSRLLAWFGVGFVVLMLPCSLTVSTLALLSTGTLWAGVFLKTSDGSLKHSVDRSGRELLYLPVPSSIKIHAKSTIDTVMDRLGDGSAGMLQILLVAVLGLGLQGSLATNLGLLLVWLLVAVRLKHAYVRQLLSSIGKPRRLEFDAAVMQDADARQTLEGILGSGTDAEKLGALEWVYRESIEVEEGLLHDLIHDASSPALRRAALAALLGRSGVELSPELLADLEAEQKGTLISVIDLLAEKDPKRSRQRRRYARPLGPSRRAALGRQRTGAASAGLAAARSTGIPADGQGPDRCGRGRGDGGQASTNRPRAGADRRAGPAGRSPAGQRGLVDDGTGYRARVDAIHAEPGDGGQGPQADPESARRAGRNGGGEGPRRHDGRFRPDHPKA